MGDRQYSELYTSLVAFLQQHGREAIEGVVERGMPLDRALEFIALLEANQVPICGLETWVPTLHGYEINLPSIWASRPGTSHDYSAARSWLQLVAPRPNDLVAVQFG